MNETSLEFLPIAESAYWMRRRTIRKFLDRQIPDDLLFSLVEKASKAPTTGGMQLYSVVITKDENILEKLRECHFNQPASKAPVLLTVVADFNRFEKWCLARDAVPGFSNFESFVSAFLDAVIFTQQLVTLLECEGIGTCYLGTATYTASKIGSVLNLPRLTVPVTSVAIGYPAETGKETERLPTGALIHDNTYSDYTVDRIEEIFAEKESLPQNKRFVEENNVPSLAHVFTDVRYPENNATYFSKDFFDYIEKQGFKFPI